MNMSIARTEFTQVSIWYKKHKKLILIIIIAILVLLAGGIFYYSYSEKHRHEFKVTFLNIGQGDSALIQFANGETMLVDCGPNKIVLARLGQELPFYDRTIDYVLATHPDLDHYGGCVDVVQRYHVKEIITNGHDKPNDPYWRNWDKTRRESGAVLKVINGFEEWHIASSTIDFYSPDDSLTVPVGAADSNNYSIVFKLTANTGKTFMFTGDMERPLEDALIGRYCPTTTPSFIVGDGLALAPSPHQGEAPAGGSKSSSSEEFVAAVGAKTAIISVGKNHYGHPSLRVLKRLERAGAQILRTDELGDIILK